MPVTPPSFPLQDNFGQDISAVEAAVRKHEAIETDIVAYSERVQAVSAVAAELEAEGYHDLKRVLARRDNVARLWDYLRELVAARRERLLLTLDLQKMLQDLAYLMDWMEEMKVPLAGPVAWALHELFPHGDETRELLQTIRYKRHRLSSHQKGNRSVRGDEEGA